MEDFPNIFPFVKSIINPSAMAAGDWERGRPLGVTVHYTADRSLDRVVTFMAKNKVGYHVIIDREGSVHQTTFFSKRVNHAGRALWSGLSPNRNHLAVALLSWGEVRPSPEAGYMAWNGTTVKTEHVVHRPANNGVMTHWDAATKEQETSLTRFISWAQAAGIKIGHVCGHDECAIPYGRKIDPGGVLSYPIGDLREGKGPLS